MRLIDANALRKRMYHDAFETDTDMQKWDSGCWIRYKMFENAIDDAPTIEQRKTGKWIPDNNNYYEERFICSVCGKSYKVDTCMGKPMWDFCPCGAKMEGGNNNVQRTDKRTGRRIDCTVH